MKNKFITHQHGANLAVDEKIADIFHATKGLDIGFSQDFTFFVDRGKFLPKPLLNKTNVSVLVGTFRSTK